MYRHFKVAADGGLAEEELNQFLASQSVLRVDREWVNDGAGSFWAYAVEFRGGSKSAGGGGSRAERIDYKEKLSPQDFAVFVRLRDWRKAKAEAEAIPPFTIFTNAQLAEIVERRCASAAALAEIDGIGKARVEKYAEEVLALLAGGGNETDPDPA